MISGRKARLVLIVLSIFYTVIIMAVVGFSSQTPAEPAETPLPTLSAKPPADDVNVVTYELDPNEVALIAKTIYGEANIVTSTEQKAAVAWCILNRADSADPFYPDTIAGVVTQPHQFAGYKSSNPVTVELYDLAADVMLRWMAEKDGAQNVGRTLPADYLFFTGDGRINYFSKTLDGTDFWDWRLPDPYEN